jgi:hypothetical protein
MVSFPRISYWTCSHALQIALNAKWDDAYEKARAALALYNLTEKVTLTTGQIIYLSPKRVARTHLHGLGVGWTVGPCVGNIGAVAIANSRAFHSLTL